MADKKIFRKISVSETVKREVGIIAASEGRFEYEIIEEALRLYKAVAIGKSPRSKNTKSVSITDVISQGQS